MHWTHHAGLILSIVAQTASLAQAYVPLTTEFPSYLDPLTLTISEIEDAFNNNTLTSVQLITEYHARITRDNHQGHNLRALIEVAPLDLVLIEARKADRLRSAGLASGPLHGVPILVKDNIATDARLGMNTTAGSYALLPEYAGEVPGDATIIAKLRAAGMIVLGKTNMCEFATYKGQMTYGWSARGGQTQTPYVLGGPYVRGGDPCGSSSGSGSAVAAGWAPVSLATETDGSIICPSSRHALYGLKPSVGVASRGGIIPISHNQDSPGPMGKSVYDVALLMSVISSTTIDPRDNATVGAVGNTVKDYTQFLTTSFGGMTLGVPNPEIFYNSFFLGSQQQVDEAYAAVRKLQNLGAKIIYNATIPSMNLIGAKSPEVTVLNHDFKQDLAAYLSTLKQPSTNYTPVRTLADVMVFNDKFHDLEYDDNQCCQEIMIQSVQTTGFDSPEYIKALHFNRDILGRGQGLDAVFARYPNLTALVVPSEGNSSMPAALAGYPMANVPLGYHRDTGAPFGLAFIGRQYDEGSLIRIMSAFEANFPPRKVPTFRRGEPLKYGTKLKKGVWPTKQNLQQPDSPKLVKYLLSQAWYPSLWEYTALWDYRLPVKF